jgi:hypothetical protein
LHFFGKLVTFAGAFILRVASDANDTSRSHVWRRHNVGASACRDRIGDDRWRSSNHRAGDTMTMCERPVQTIVVTIAEIR